MSDNDKEQVSTLRNGCINCPRAQSCLLRGLNKHEVEQFSRMVKHPRPLRRGNQLFMIGDKFSSLVVVHSGSIKSYITSSNGQQQITGFYMPGDLLGVDAISSGKHCYTVEALETTSVCQISYRDFSYCANRSPILQARLLDVLSQQLVDKQQMLLLLGKMTAEQRLASFLLDLSRRMSIRGMSSRMINLPMSRNDIANYLGLVIETISRLLTRMQSNGILAVQRRMVSIENHQALEMIADNSADNYRMLEHVA